MCLASILCASMCVETTYLLQVLSIADSTSGWMICTPLNPSSIEGLLDALPNVFGDNTAAAVFSTDGMALSLHYATIVQAMKFCPTVFMFGPPGAGKATALNMALQLTGGISNRCVTNVTRPAQPFWVTVHSHPFPLGLIGLPCPYWRPYLWICTKEHKS